MPIKPIEPDSFGHISAPTGGREITVCRRITEGSAPVSNYINALTATRFSDVMRLPEPVLRKRPDKRAAAFLPEESNAL